MNNFPSSHHSAKPDTINSRFTYSDKIKTPVPGHPNLAINLMAHAWNEIFELRNCTTVGKAKIAAKRWARSLKN